eukprot:Awhi_evm5s7873
MSQTNNDDEKTCLGIQVKSRRRCVKRTSNYGGYCQYHLPQFIAKLKEEQEAKEARDLASPSSSLEKIKRVRGRNLSIRKDLNDTKRVLFDSTEKIQKLREDLHRQFQIL